MKEQTVPECAGIGPATHDNPPPWKPDIQAPSVPETIAMPDEFNDQKNGGYPNSPFKTKSITP